MPKTYTCEKCLKTFKQKGHFTEHQNKKNDCANPRLEDLIEQKVEQKIKEVIEKKKKDVEIKHDSKLQETFENIHNLLWNKAGFNPEKALRHMNLFFAYRMLEPYCISLGSSMPIECRWSHLVKLSLEDSPQTVFTAVMEGCRSFCSRDVTKPFFFRPEIQKVDDMVDIIHIINQINDDQFQQTDTLGAIFEYMLGRGMSMMADEGQYFTMRPICHLARILAFKIKNNILRRPDGSLCTFADWFCGTGGFTVEYIRGVNEVLGSENVNWKVDQQSIYSQDQNESAVSTTLLNALVATSVPFSPNTIRKGNSFYDSITCGNNAPFPGLEIDYCFMNPPYGGDSSKGKAYKFAYIKGKGKEKQYLVNHDIRSIGIEDNDKVSAGIQLAMATLSKDGGVCCIVLPQGFFFGKKSVELRKILAEEYRIHYIVDIASGAFVNTGTKTSMIVFQRGVGPTEKIEFIDMAQNVLVEATMEDLRKKSYSLNYKQYLPQENVNMDGFEMVKLGDIAKKLTTRGKHSTKDSIDGGKYSLFSSSINQIYNLNTFDYSETCCIINSTNASGNAIVNLAKNFSVTSDTFVFKCENDVTTTYIHLYLSSNIELVKETFQGGNHKHPTWDRLSNIQIPLPSLERQQEIVESIDGFTQLAHAEEQSLKLLEKSVMFEVKWMGQGKERVKLGDVLIPVKGKKYAVRNDGNDTGKYPLLRSSSDGKVKWMDTYEFEGPYITAGNGGEANFKLSEKFNASTHTLVYDVNNTQTLKSFVYYSIQTIRDKINDLCFQGSGLKNLSIPLFMDLQIPLPSLEEQETLQPEFDEIRHKYEKIAQYRKKAQDAINRLIPGANNANKNLSHLSHSSACDVKEDGSGCTCR